MSELLFAFIIIAIYDIAISMLSFYSFYILILRPRLKYRNTKKNGLYTELALFDNGEFQGALTLNLSELFEFLLKTISEASDKEILKK
jgi:hypothetical protein